MSVSDKNVRFDSQKPDHALARQFSFVLAMKKIFAAIQPVTAIPSERLNRRYHTS